MKRTIFAVISIALMLFAFTACSQTTVIPVPEPKPDTPDEEPVKPSGPTAVPADGLETAIESASDGSTIYLSGTYKLSEPLTIDKNITFIGLNNAEIEFSNSESAGSCPR